MGLLIDGQWHDKWYDTKRSKGKFERESAKLRNWITPDGREGATGKGGFKAESGRYHLYVSLACPWAHRTLIFRKLKQLEAHIDVSVVDPDMLDQGWSFLSQRPEVEERVYGLEFMHQLYTKNDKSYSGRVTVPVLWDKQTAQIVSNESSEIIRMFNNAFNHITGDSSDYYPHALRSEIDEINDFVYHNINNGVYKAGFATTQDAYRIAVHDLFEALDEIETRLANTRYLVAGQLTEADWRLFTTLLRFDSVYHGHFKCNIKQIEDYPNLSAYLRDLYQHAGIAETVNFEHIKRHYYFSHTMINPTQVVPEGPNIDYLSGHNRHRLSL
ncbi:glutathione S-transferase family protein [Pseudoalteromonas sp. McH1-7]|uniref:Putative glutathione S-transferase n=1 Tax=Pseudoalteromonas peptidolytica F12-50-A1 TaxID=1315280 RepID=A0A8I0MZS5_9GAMM|nr:MULTISPECIES: glutathione S-transferase family protein [Pseudoalteromonas]MBE0348935.1 putative glutathione S-transferase [Pseudoalteromonas peptidolytica F12-50-A1]NLR16325.1 glutathione S-transferase family protein [Pseudoalteromonas peptidolytica]NUZ10934.1 glutathione S-transferase family protein [Pseudoalteromonas sp. McH1-7]USD30498.1 glutathione S-transferase family protein [Pseudoalteromonas sp. SCSIO 43201]GEK11196.1 glutathione-dependent reductase [Pseudoalteromonas peptidolytica]